MERENETADETRALERLAATLRARGLGPEAAVTRALDATIRPPGLAERHRGADGAEPAPARTAPFLPSITLSEGREERAPAGEGGADLLVGERLGEGGMGVVHVAAQRSLERSVAIKRPVADHGAAGLVDEGRVMALVEHPNVVPVHALGRDGSGRPVLVMKRVQGASFRALLRDEAHAAWPPLLARWGDRESAALGILSEVTDALGLAHARGIVHRDVKPENVMVGEFGEVYLLDWGLAHRIGAPDEARAGSIVGTPGFMAPEMVLDPDAVDARTDVYLLGATLHEVLTGTLRHRGDSLYETLALAMASAPVRYGAEVPEDLAALANAATHRDPGARPASAAEFRRALTEHARRREANTLVQAAREALSPLASGALALEESAASGALAEAAAALAAAARAHADGAQVRAARREHLLLSIRRELSLESPQGARALAARLEQPEPELEARIGELEERLRRAKASEEALQREREEADVSGWLRTRLVVIAAVFVPVFVLTAVLSATGALGGAELSTAGFLVTDVGATTVFLVGLFLARRYLFANRGHRRLSGYAAIGFAAITGSHALSHLVGDAPAVALAHSFVMHVAFFALGALQFTRVFALGALTSALVAVLLTLFPEQASAWSLLGMLGVIVTGLAGTLAYGRATRRVSPSPSPRAS